MSSLLVREARENIINYINTLQLPMEVKRLVLKEILGQLETASEQEILMQIKERDEKKSLEKENEVRSSE